jgi:hypothetical protein
MPMNNGRKSKAASQKSVWQAIRRRYTWHLRLAFKRRFDHSHWWKDKENEIESAAALNELARRHPLVNETPPKIPPPPGTSFVTLPSFLEPKPSLRSTQCLAMKSWPKLTTAEREEWKSSIGVMKGLDFRDNENLCISLTKLAHTAIFQLRQIRHREDMQTWPEILKGVFEIIGFQSLAANPTEQEWEATIAQQAIEAHRQGYFLLAVPSKLKADMANSAMSKAYGECKKLFPSTEPSQRARWHDWLPLIESFEKSGPGDKDYAQKFNRYRRALDGIRFV